MREKERKEITACHPDGEIPGPSVDFGARADDLRTQQEIGKRNLGMYKELPNGSEKQVIVQGGHIPLPIKIGIGVAAFGIGVFGTYRMVKLFVRTGEKDHWETKKKKQNSPVDKS